jgi:putative nucleotidyltransferase with HDIG domain
MTMSHTSSPIAQRSALLNASMLARLAQRWRPAGLHVAFLDKTAAPAWQDPEMPRLLALVLTHPALIAACHAQPEPASPVGPLFLVPGLEVRIVPIVRRRKLTGYLAVFARTAQLDPRAEELAIIAQRAAADATFLAAQANKLPLLPAPQVDALVPCVEQMHEDLHLAATTSTELSGVTGQLTALYEEISLLHKIASGMRFSQKPDAFLEVVCREVQDTGNFRCVGVAMASREDDAPAPVLADLAVLVGDCPTRGNELLAALHEPIYDALKLGEAQVHNDIPPDCDWSRLAASAKRFVCVPLMRDRRPLGVLIAIDKADNSEFSSVDLKLLGNVGNQCSIFLENAALYQDMQGLFMGVLHALTHSIDAKDAYTRGHSQRVAELSRALARKIGLSDQECERVYLSGLLHDVGKIGVPEAVLTKPGRLTDAEFDAIKKHPTIGAQILGNIKQLQDIIPGVLYHHERWDGKGYPYRLAGEDIPLIGRIICVADSFDAMSSTRTYRPALPLETVLDEIKRCAGVQFDARLAAAFVTLDFEPYRRAVAEHNRQAPAAETPPASGAPA